MVINLHHLFDSFLFPLLTFKLELVLRGFGISWNIWNVFEYLEHLHGLGESGLVG